MAARAVTHLVECSRALLPHDIHRNAEDCRPCGSSGSPAAAAAAPRISSSSSMLSVHHTALQHIRGVARSLGCKPYSDKRPCVVSCPSGCVASLSGQLVVLYSPTVRRFRKKEDEDRGEKFRAPEMPAAMQCRARPSGRAPLRFAMTFV